MVPLFRDRHWYDWREVEVEVDDAAGRVAGLHSDQRSLQELMVSSARAAADPLAGWPAEQLGS